MKKLLKVLFLAFLIASFIAPGFTVYAIEADVSDSDIPKEVAEADAAQESNELGNGKKGALFLAYHRLDDIIEPEITSESTGTFPEKYDLRELGVVTPVKSQNPFGTCWGFATIAASETSILSSMGKTYEETGLDLSEHHLTYFARTHIDDYLSRYYAVGIVNPGESYVYIDEIGQWFDFADMIDTLRLNSEALFEYDYDNFSIKSYAQFKDPARAEQIANETEIEELNYAEPATEINVKVLKSYLIGALLALVVLIILIIVLVKAIKKKIARKRMEKLAGDDNTQVSQKVDEQKSTAEGNNE